MKKYYNFISSECRTSHEAYLMLTEDRWGISGSQNVKQHRHQRQ